MKILISERQLSSGTSVWLFSTLNHVCTPEEEPTGVFLLSSSWRGDQMTWAHKRERWRKLASVYFHDAEGKHFSSITCSLEAKLENILVQDFVTSISKLVDNTQGLLCSRTIPLILANEVGQLSISAC